MTEINNKDIPVFKLKHKEERVSFVLRTMEEIDQKTSGKPDKPHRHDYYTILWAQKACGIHIIDFVEYNIAPDLIFFVNPGQVHQVISFPNPVGIVIMFEKEFLVKYDIREDFVLNLGLFSDSTETPPLQLKGKNTSQLYFIAEQLRIQFFGNSDYKYDAIGALMKLFLIECNKFTNIAVSGNSQLIHSTARILKKFKDLLEIHFKDWHQVKKYADALAITPDYLNDVVKSSTGKTAKAFIQDRLVLEAKRLAIHTKLSLKEIAYQAGFNDPAHFSKFFKSREGQSFTDFRLTILE